MTELFRKINGTDAFSALYESSFEGVYAFVYARTGNAADAEEIVQETYASAWASMAGFQNRSRDSTWVIAIARHKIADYYRRAIRRENNEEPGDIPETAPSGLSLESVVIGGETREYVARALGALSAVHRYALVMKYLDGCSMKEIAGALGRSPKAVDGLLQRAKASFTRQYLLISGGVRNDG